MSNDTGTLTLTDFLLARIAEDEDVARASHPHARWWVESGPAKSSGTWWVYDAGAKFKRQQDAAFVAYNDPARVLAECKAKRRIVNEHRIPAVRFSGGEVWAPCILALAAVYSDHPDYRDEWSNDE